MTTTLAAKGLYLVSIGWAVFATVRWYFMYPDISQLIFGLTASLVLANIAYTQNGFRTIVNNQKKADNEQDKEIKGIGEIADREVNYVRKMEDRLEEQIKEFQDTNKVITE